MNRRRASAPRASEASSTKVAELRYDSAFSHGNIPSEAQKQRLLGAARDRGLRLLPYPFASAVSIVSDLDGTTRQRYDGYVRQIVRDLGLDFGDSTWLQWVSRFCRAESARETSGALSHQAYHAGFLSYDFSLGLDEHPGVYKTARTFAEQLAEFHLGNVDHFHALLPRGPRVVVLDEPRLGDREIEFHNRGYLSKRPQPGTANRLPRDRVSARFRCPETLLALAVCVVAKPGRSLPELSVEVIDREGGSTDSYRPIAYPNPPNRRQHRLLAIVPPLDRPRLPRLLQVDRVIVRLEGGGDPTSVDRVLLFTALGDLLLDRLTLLRERYNIELGLLTDHAAWHFRNERAAAARDEIMKQQRRPGERLPVLGGTLIDDDGEVVFTTEADDPTSTCQVLPGMSERHGLRFVTPAGHTASSTTGWDPLDLVSPAKTRAGTGIYISRRMLPNIRPPLPGKTFDGTRSRKSTFTKRLRRVLDGTADSPGLMWPIYTHIGALETDLENPVPSPYFEDAEPLRKLQDRVYNVSGDVASGGRIWFCRASVLYEYALMLRQVAERVDRPDANTVHIRSWHDPILDKTLPFSPSQLYGLTFHVDDASTARVLLDDEPIETLTRNPADETGRASVTVAESEIRHVLFARLDPSRNLPSEIDLEGRWRWLDDEQGLAYGRLTPAAGGGERLARLRLPLFGLEPWGAQLICFDARRERGSRLGLLLETRTGGRFFFGDRQLLTRLEDPPTASYLFEPGNSPAWRRHVAPFHDLAWAPGTRPGGPMPNHALEALTVLCDGDADGRGVELGSVALLRPRATTLSRSTDALCLGGRVPDSPPGSRVFATLAEASSSPRHECLVDPRGHFCFARLPPGIYRVWAERGADKLCDRRGLLVELSANLSTLVLNRPSE